MPKSLRKEIDDALERDYPDNLDEIMYIITKRIDKVEKDYRKPLNPYLKKLPMKEVYPKEMDALNRVRKEIL